MPSCRSRVPHARNRNTHTHLLLFTSGLKIPAPPSSKPSQKQGVLMWDLNRRFCKTGKYPGNIHNLCSALQTSSAKHLKKSEKCLQVLHPHQETIPFCLVEVGKMCLHQPCPYLKTSCSTESILPGTFRLGQLFLRKETVPLASQDKPFSKITVKNHIPSRGFLFFPAVFYEFFCNLVKVGAAQFSLALVGVFHMVYVVNISCRVELGHKKARHSFPETLFSTNGPSKFFKSKRDKFILKHCQENSE